MGKATDKIKRRIGGGMMYHNDRLAGQAYIYNDYFLLEVVLRLLGKHFMVWGYDK